MPRASDEMYGAGLSPCSPTPNRNGAGNSVSSYPRRPLEAHSAHATQKSTGIVTAVERLLTTCGKPAAGTAPHATSLTSRQCSRPHLSLSSRSSWGSIPLPQGKCKPASGEDAAAPCWWRPDARDSSCLGARAAGRALSAADANALQCCPTGGKARFRWWLVHAMPGANPDHREGCANCRLMYTPAAGRQACATSGMHPPQHGWPRRPSGHEPLVECGRHSSSIGLT